MIKNILALFFLGLVLVSCNVSKSQTTDSSVTLEGNWELNYISGPRIAFNGLYPGKKPSLNFDLKEARISGNTSCNSFNGKLSTDGNKIDFTQPMALTKMMCENGQGEQVFLNTLQKVNTYSITDNGKTLNLISGDVATMRFAKK